MTSDGHLVKPQLQPRVIAGLAYAAGWTELHDLTTAVAICLAESQGYADSYNYNLAALATIKPGAVVGLRGAADPEITAVTVIAPSGTVEIQKGDQKTVPPLTEVVVSIDTGLWQINRPAEDIGSNALMDLADPALNVAAAYQLWKARGFEPWASYTSGIYLDDSYALRALLGVMNLAGAGVIDAQAKVTDPARVEHHTLRLPVISIEQARRAWPKVEM